MKINNEPIFDVPHRCPTNKQIMIITVIGTTHLCKFGAFKAKPSTADNTDTAGVNAPSPFYYTFFISFIY
jgi:hypothetical protein